MLPTIVAILAIALLLLVLGAIVRFSIVSSWRTRGASDRLTEPDVSGVERVCGFPPPADLVQMYRDGALTTRVEFALVDTARQPPRTWFFGGFYPLTANDVSEQRKIHGLTSGIPIAGDLDKGVYFVTRDGAVLFRPAGRNAPVTQVALSAAALSRFEIQDDLTAPVSSQ